MVQTFYFNFVQNGGSIQVNQLSKLAKLPFLTGLFLLCFCIMYSILWVHIIITIVHYCRYILVQLMRKYLSILRQEKQVSYLVVLVPSVVLADEAHDGGCGLTLLLEADELCGVGRVSGAARPLTGLLWQWHAPVLGQGARGVWTLAAHLTQVRCADGTVEHGGVRVILITPYAQLLQQQSVNTQVNINSL